MANGLFNLPGYLKDKEGEEALLQYAENPDISLTGQVNQLRGGDDFQAQFENLKKLPSTIPKMNQETRDLYGKYNKFLQFYGASSGDYSGSSAFQSGLTSALDMDMIQDLLEEQRSTSLSNQFGNMMPYFKDLPDVAKFATKVGANLTERKDLGQIYKNSRADVAYQHEILQLQDKWNDMSTDEAVRHFITNAAPFQLTPGQIVASANNFVSKLSPGQKADDFIKGVTDYAKFNTLEGGDAGGKFNFNHILPYNDKVSAAFTELGMHEGRHYTIREGDKHAGGKKHLHINPRYTHDIDTTRPSNMNALRELEIYGITPYKASLSGTSYRAMEGDQPVGMPFLDSNQPLLEMMHQWTQQGPDRRIVKDPGFSDVLSTRTPLESVAARDQKTMQAAHARGISNFADLGLAALDAGAGPGSARAQFLITHVNEMAKDWGGLAGLYKGGTQPTPVQLLSGIMEHNTNAIQDLMGAGQGDLTDDQYEEMQDVLKGWSEENQELGNQLASPSEEQINQFAQVKDLGPWDEKKGIYTGIKDQYTAQILLEMVETALQAQVARMYIDKDRMLASFYNAIKERIQLTGWLGTNKEARARLMGVKSHAEHRAGVAEEMLKPVPGSGFQQDIVSGDISYPQAQQQQQTQPEVPPIQDLDINSLNEEQLNLLFQKRFKGGNQ